MESPQGPSCIRYSWVSSCRKSRRRSSNSSVAPDEPDSGFRERDGDGLPVRRRFGVDSCDRPERRVLGVEDSLRTGERAMVRGELVGDAGELFARQASAQLRRVMRARNGAEPKLAKVSETPPPDSAPRKYSAA